MEWTDIIQKILEVKGLNLHELSHLLDTDYRYMHNLKSGRSKNPKTEFIQILIEKANINPLWIFTGQGSILLEEPSEPKEDSGSKDKEIEELRKALEEKERQIHDLSIDPKAIKLREYEQKIIDLKKSIDEIQKEYDEIKAETNQSVEQLKDKVISLQEQLLMRNTGTNTI